MKEWLLVAVISVSGCSVNLTKDGQKVRVVNESQRESCEFIALVSVNSDLGPDKPGSALKKALNETASQGGNGLFIITNTIHWFDGASVSGEALRCK